MLRVSHLVLAPGELGTEELAVDPVLLPNVRSAHGGSLPACDHTEEKVVQNERPLFVR